jgi:perosamine synthetase
VFVDVEPDYWQIDSRSMAAFLVEDCERRPEGVVNRRTGRRVRAVIPVDILGHPADLDAIAGIANRYGLALVEDATESLGAAYRGRPLGSVSPLTAFSFNGNKLLTTGGGGMLAASDPVVAERARYLTTQAKDDAVEFVHRQVGYNYRLTNVQAAIGVAQLERIGEFLTRKREIAAVYTERLGRLPGVEPMREAEWATSAFWLYTIRLGAEAPLDRKELMAALATDEIETRPLWQPLHRSPAHADAYARPCPAAERLNDTCLSLPSSTNLTGEQLDRVCASIARAFDGTRRRGASGRRP